VLGGWLIESALAVAEGGLGPYAKRRAQRRWMRRWVMLYLAAFMSGAAVGGCGGSGHPAAVRSAAAPTGTVHLTLGAPGRAVPRGFLGLSIEFQAVRAYTGSDPSAINPVFETLVRGLSPAQSPVLRIGGDSTDMSWYGPAAATAPVHASYRLTPSWLAITSSLAHAIDARMILGLNLAGDDPASDAAEAAADVQAFGSTLAAFEIGNEPNLYATIFHVRSADYGPARYRQEIRAIVSALPSGAAHVPLVGPALSAGPDPAGAGPWLTQMAAVLRSEPRMTTLSVHRYPLKHCYHMPPGSPQDPTIAHLLSSYSTVSLADSIHRWVAIARAQGVRLRVDELNSAACNGKSGVSDTFAASLWSTDALFSLLSAGADAVNVHTLPNSFYELFTFKHSEGRWTADVKPIYYGLRLFAQAAPLGSRLLTVDGATHTQRLSTWATTTGHTDRLVLIDKDPGHADTVTVRAPAGATATVERMTAPSVSSAQVNLGGRSYGQRTSTGRLAAPVTTTVRRGADGTCTIQVPGASAALLTFTMSA
jgi:hypothetical protein